MTTNLPDVGDVAPDFTLLDAQGAEVSLSRLRRQAGDPLLLPGRDDPRLHDRGLRLQRRQTRARLAGVTVIGVSPDAPAKLAAFTEKSGLDVTLLSDPERTVLKAYGAYGEKQNYGRTVMGVIRSTFVIGPDGTIEKAWRNIKATGHVARVLRDIGLAA